MSSSSKSFSRVALDSVSLLVGEVQLKGWMVGLVKMINGDSAIYMLQ